MLPVTRRRSDDRCSLLTQWTESSASLKSCVSHSAVSRSLAESVSTPVESDGRAYMRRAGTGCGQPEHRDRCCRRRLDATSSSNRFVDSNLCSRHSKNNSRKCEFAGSAVRHDYGTTRRRTVSQSSSLRDNNGRRHSWGSISAARRRRATARDVNNHDDDDDDYVTSSEGDDHPSTSTSSSAPSNCVDDRASLLSNTTESSSAVFTAQSPCRPSHQSSRQLAEPSLERLSRHSLPSPKRRKSTDSSRSLTTSNDTDFDDNDLERSKSSEEIVVASRNTTETATDQSLQDELRAVRRLFEFRSSDELRIANNFIDGVLSLCSRRSLYNERYICPKPALLTSTSSTSLYQLYYSRSEKDSHSDVGSDAGEIVSNNDRKSSFNDITEGSLVTAYYNQDDADDHNNRGLNVADVSVHFDGVEALDDWKSSRKEYRHLEMIPELNDVTATISNEDDLKICIRKLPKTYNDIPNNTPSWNTEVPDTEHRVPLPKPVKTACNEQLKHTAISDSLLQQQNETAAVGEKSRGLSTLLSDLLANGPGVKTSTEAVDNNSQFAAELIQVFDALLVRPGVREMASVDADIKMFQPLTNGANDYTAIGRPDASKLLQLDTDSVDTILAKSTGDEFGSLADTAAKSAKRAVVDMNKCRKERERESDVLWRLTPRLSVKPELTCDLASTASIEPVSHNAKEANSETPSPKQPACYDNDSMIATMSTQTNDFNDDPQSTGETRMRISRKSRGRGKVRELIKLFESASASTLDNSASPVDVKRATISAAVSIGELLRRASEQEVTSCSQCASALPDVNDKQPRITSPKSTSALISADVAQAHRLLKPEAPVVVHKATARWPTMSRIRPKHTRRHVLMTSVGDHTALRIDVDQLSKTRNSRTAPANNDSENLPRVDNIIGKALEAVPLPSKPINDESPECQGTSIKVQTANASLRTKRPEACGCEVANVSTTSNRSSSVIVSGLPTVVDAVSSLSPASRQENVHQLPSSQLSSTTSSQWPLKSLHTYEVAVTSSTINPSSGGSGDIGGHRGEAGHASTDGNKQLAARFNYETHPSASYTVHSRHMFLPSGGLPREQSLSTNTPHSAAETTNRSAETTSPEVAINDDCQRFSVLSWFIAGGPRMVEVPPWQLKSGKDVVVIVNQGKSRVRRPAKATLETETSCPTAYPLLRMSGVTIHLLSKDDVNNTQSIEGNETVSGEYRGGRRPRTQSTKKQLHSYNFQAAKQKSSRTDTKLAKGDEQLSEKSASCRTNSESVCSAEITKTTGHDHEFDVVASSGAAFRGRGDDVKTPAAQTNRDCLKQNCKSASTNRRAASDVARAPDHCPHPDIPLSKRSSLSKQSDIIPSLNRTSSIIAKCGLVSGESIQSPGGVTVVHSRRRPTSDRPPAADAATTPSQVSDATQLPATENYRRLAQQFLLTSLLEYRLEAQRR